MKMNMGNADRFLRGLVAISLIALNIKGIITGGIAIAAIIIAVIFMLTSLVGFCPAYSIFGFSSRRIRS
jgi:DUF2892 family protein